MSTKHDISELRQMQALPLDMKIKLTERRIRDWYNYWAGAVYISFSGGKDSTVLLNIARNIYPDIEAVFVNTGLEYPEIQTFVKTFENVKILYPEKTFCEVLTEYGYPVLSKIISHNVSIARRKPDGNISKNLFHSGKRSKFNCVRYIPMLSMDFMTSDRCCDIMKKDPAHKYAEESGKVAITAQMACESRMRMQKWFENGCNAFETRNPVSNPMSFWTEQDVLLYIKSHEKEMVQRRIDDLEKKYGCPLEEIIDTETGKPAYPRDEITPICSVYGDIVPENDQFTMNHNCKLKTTGCKRTGCVYCGFGCHLEKGQTRFQRLKETHPKQYDFCINGGQYNDKGLWVPSKKGLGLAHIFDELNKVYGEDFISYK